MSTKSFGEAVGALYEAFGTTAEAVSTTVDAAGENAKASVTAPTGAKVEQVVPKKGFFARLTQCLDTLNSNLDTLHERAKKRLETARAENEIELPIIAERIKARAEANIAEHLARIEVKRRQDPVWAYFYDNAAKIRAEAVANGGQISPEWFKNSSQPVPTSSPQRFLSGREHLDFLLASIRNAKRSVVILSGWISAKVVDPHFIGLVDKKLSQGCSVTIAYGFADGSGEHVSSPKSREAVRQLHCLSKKYRSIAAGSLKSSGVGCNSGHTAGTLTLGKYPNHEKLLVIDEEFMVVGSNNWLSNATFTNAERSLVILDPRVASAEAARVKETVLRNSEPPCQEDS